MNIKETLMMLINGETPMTKVIKQSEQETELDRLNDECEAIYLTLSDTQKLQFMRVCKTELNELIGNNWVDVGNLSHTSW